MKANKGLSDRELIDKYEAGAINLANLLKKTISEPDRPKRAAKKTNNSK
jgi:hypothetical protein